MGTIANFDAVKFQHHNISPDKKQIKLLLMNTLILIVLIVFFTMHIVIRFWKGNWTHPYGKQQSITWSL